MKKNKAKKDKPLVVTGNFDDLIKASVSGNSIPKPKKKKGVKK